MQFWAKAQNPAGLWASAYAVLGKSPKSCWTADQEIHALDRCFGQRPKILLGFGQLLMQFWAKAQNPAGLWASAYAVLGKSPKSSWALGKCLCSFGQKPKILLGFGQVLMQFW